MQIIAYLHYQKILDKRTEMTDSSRTKLLVNGVEAAWEQTEGRYYISQSLSEGYWKGVLTAQVDGPEVSAGHESVHSGWNGFPLPGLH